MQLFPAQPEARSVVGSADEFDAGRLKRVLNLHKGAGIARRYSIDKL